jgi:uncharacterized protein YndB with AHSA1/START domain
MGQRQVSATRIVASVPEKVFALLTDPAQHPVLDGSGTVRAAREGSPERLTLGSRFGMAMRMGLPYRIENTVVEFEENRLIAWRHFYGHRWRWRLEPVEDGTRVTETFDWSTARVPFLIDLSPYPRKNREAIERSLDRLAELVAS